MAASLTTEQIEALNSLFDHIPAMGKPKGVATIALGDVLADLEAASPDGFADSLASTDAAEGASLIGVQDAAATITGATVEAALAELSKRFLGAFANEAAIKALVAAKRTDGALAVDLTNDVIWSFDAGSSAGASAWVLVPDVGTGRWVRKNASLADLASVVNAFGASLIGIEDAGALFAAEDVEAALAEVKTLADAAIGVVKRTVTIGHADLVDGDGSQDINIGAALPANARIAYTDMHTFTPFSGGGANAVSVDIGTAGDVDAIVDGADLFAAAVDGGPATIPKGVRPNKLLAAGGQLIARVDADVNVADLDAGAVTIDVYYFVSA